MLVEAPSEVCPAIALLDLGNRVVSSTPKILDVVEANSLKCETALQLVPLVDASADSVSLRFSTDEDLASDENGTVVAA